MRARASGGLVAALVVLAVGCAHAPPPQAPQPSTAASAPGEEQAADGRRLPVDTVAAWTIYAVTLAGLDSKPDAPSDFGRELVGRTTLADAWRSRRAKVRVPDPYLDKLVEVADAGFMPEYVVAYLPRPGWLVSGGELGKLNFTGFRAWAATHLGEGHEPQTLARVTPAGKPPPVPGAGLPSSPDLDPSQTSCAQIEPRIARVVATWDAEAARLRQVPISVFAADQLLASFDRASRDPRARRDGVVLVSSKAAQTLFVAGFCAVDRKAYAEAEPFLRRAVTLSPGNANIRSELIQTLIGQKKLDEADAELTVAMEVAVSPCHKAIVLRKRGYILIERGRLLEAYKVYASSLEYDPSSEIAHREMKLIVSELRHAGGYNEKALEAYKPPPQGDLTVTKCK